MKLVLDTNVIVRLFDADERILRRLEKFEPGDIGIPTLVLAELWFGAEKSARKEANRARVEGLTKQFKILMPGAAIARRYGVVRAELERKGRIKSDFDLVIACTALEKQATLVTNDGALKDGAIEGLKVEDWLNPDDE